MQLDTAQFHWLIAYLSCLWKAKSGVVFYCFACRRFVLSTHTLVEKKSKENVDLQ